MRIEFSTRQFEFAHGRLPRGTGAWAFQVGDGEPVFAPASTYAEAKRWMAARLREAASAHAVTVTVCS